MRAYAVTSLLFLSALASSFAQDRGTPIENAFVWGGLVQATNKSLTTTLTDKEKTLSEQLRNASFNYKNFDLISEHTQQVLRDFDTWLIPSDELYLKIDYNGEEKGGMNLQMQLWRKQDIVLKTSVILRSDSPLFIAGPKWGDDQLILVVELRDDGEG